MQSNMTGMAGGTCPECGHNERTDRLTIQKALPVVLEYLKVTSVAEILSSDLKMGMAVEDVVTRALERLAFSIAN